MPNFAAPTFSHSTFNWTTVILLNLAGDRCREPWGRALGLLQPTLRRLSLGTVSGKGVCSAHGLTWAHFSYKTSLVSYVLFSLLFYISLCVFRELCLPIGNCKHYSARVRRSGRVQTSKSTYLHLRLTARSSSANHVNIFPSRALDMPILESFSITYHDVESSYIP